MKTNAPCSCGRVFRNVCQPRHCLASTPNTSLVVRQKLSICRAQQPFDAGDSRVQESLVDMLQLELAKAKIREDVRKDLEERKENIKLIGEELVEEFQKELELDKLRMELASGSSLADTLAQFKELDDEIQGIRDQLQADQQDLIDFETRSANQQNSGLFFKQLYKAPEQEVQEGGQTGQQGGGKAKKQTLVVPQVVQQLRSDIQAPAVKEVHSPLRLYIFTYLTLVLLYVVASDVGSGQPASAQDLLYVVLAGGLGYNALAERQALSKAMDEEEKKQQDKE